MTKFKDVAHFYLGCEIQTTEGKKATFDAYYFQSNTEQVISNDLVNADLSFGEFKPILRPLSSMTDEECIHLIKMKWAQYPQKFSVKIDRIKSNDIRYSAFDGEKHVVSGSLSVSTFSPEEFLFLLSKGFDLFGLIESGESLSATTL